MLFLPPTFFWLSLHLKQKKGLQKVAENVGDPKTKFFCLLFSTVRRPPIRPTIKNFTWHGPCPTSNVRRPTWGQSYTDVYNPTPSYTPHQGGTRPYQRGPQGGPIRKLEGRGRRVDDEGQRWTVDGRKFLLLFRKTQFYMKAIFPLTTY